jgi:hypothetical protein
MDNKMDLGNRQLEIENVHLPIQQESDANATINVSQEDTQILQISENRQSEINTNIPRQETYTSTEIRSESNNNNSNNGNDNNIQINSNENNNENSNNISPENTNNQTIKQLDLSDSQLQQSNTTQPRTNQQPNMQTLPAQAHLDEGSNRIITDLFNGFSQGYIEGHQQGFDDGLKAGYEEGYKLALTQENNYRPVQNSLAIPQNLETQARTLPQEINNNQPIIQQAPEISFVPVQTEAPQEEDKGTDTLDNIYHPPQEELPESYDLPVQFLETDYVTPIQQENNIEANIDNSSQREVETETPTIQEVENNNNEQPNDINGNTITEDQKQEELAKNIDPNSNVMPEAVESHPAITVEQTFVPLPTIESNDNTQEDTLVTQTDTSTDAVLINNIPTETNNITDILTSTESNTSPESSVMETESQTIGQNDQALAVSDQAESVGVVDANEEVQEEFQIESPITPSETNAEGISQEDASTLNLEQEISNTIFLSIF